MRKEPDDDLIEHLLRERLSAGVSLEAAIRQVRPHARGGTLWIYLIVQRITGMPGSEAMLATARALVTERRSD